MILPCLYELPHCLHFCFILPSWRYCETACSALNLPHPPWLGLNKEHGDQKSLIRTCKPWVTEGLFPSNLKQHPNNKIKLKYWMGSLLPFFCKQLNGPVSRMDSTTGTETCGVLFFYVLGFLFFFCLHTPATWKPARECLLLYYFSCLWVQPQHLLPKKFSFILILHRLCARADYLTTYFSGGTATHTFEYGDYGCKITAATPTLSLLGFLGIDEKLGRKETFH